MKQLTIIKLAEQIKKLMLAKKMTPKELAHQSNISYSSLMPILNGIRECGISKLIDIAEALECTPDALLKDCFSEKAVKSKSYAQNHEPTARYLTVFVSIIKVTYCRLYDTKNGLSHDMVLPFPMRCGDDADSFLHNIFITLEKMAGYLNAKVEFNDVAVFASVQQYGRKINREKIQLKGEALFSRFVLESDAITNHQAFIGKNDGICISINTGDMITYSNDAGKTISSMHGYGFPISDVAGNYWIGCEAIKHVINVKEQLEPSSLISDRLLALSNDDVSLLCAKTMEDPLSMYVMASGIVKELIHNRKAYQIVQKSFSLLFSDIELIDQKIGKKLPIALAGELAELYEGYFPKDRLLKIGEQQSVALLNYGINYLRNLIKHH